MKIVPASAESLNCTRRENRQSIPQRLGSDRARAYRRLTRAILFEQASAHCPGPSRPRLTARVRLLPAFAYSLRLADSSCRVYFSFLQKEECVFLVPIEGH